MGSLSSVTCIHCTTLGLVSPLLTIKCVSLITAARTIHWLLPNTEPAKNVSNRRWRIDKWLSCKFEVGFPPTYSSSSSSSVICQTTGTKPLPKRFVHIVRSRASSFNWQYALLSLRSSSSFSRLLPRLLVTSICLFIFPSITCSRRQFRSKMRPIQLAFRFLISCRIPPTSIS